MRLRVKLELPVRSRLLSLFIQTFAERQLRLPNSQSFSWTLAMLSSPSPPPQHKLAESSLARAPPTHVHPPRRRRGG